MNYKDEWRLLAISDNLDDVEHRPLTEKFLFYQAVATGDVEVVRKNCEQERLVSEDGVGTLSRNPHYQFEISLCHYDSYDYTHVWSKWYGIRTSF